jgi:hypothetical protein
MNSRFLRRFLPLGLALAILATPLTTYPARADSDENDNSLTGSWLFKLSNVLPVPNNFLALGTFTNDGSFVGTAQGDGTALDGNLQNNGPTEGPAHGVWKKTGDGTFAVTFHTIWHQPDASLFGVFTINEKLILDPRGRLALSYTGQLVGPNGNLIFALQGTGTGERIQLQ